MGAKAKRQQSEAKGNESAMERRVVSNIDVQLSHMGLRRVVGYRYKVEDCLFDSIAYVLEHDGAWRDWGGHVSSEQLRRMSMELFREQWQRRNPLAVLHEQQIRMGREARLEGLGHLSRANPVEDYINRMSVSAAAGGSWGDYIAIVWLSMLLRAGVVTWSVETGGVLSSTYEMSDGTNPDVNIGYIPGHYQPIIHQASVPTRRQGTAKTDDVAIAKRDERGGGMNSNRSVIRTQGPAAKKAGNG